MNVAVEDIIFFGQASIMPKSLWISLYFLSLSIFFTCKILNTFIDPQREQSIGYKIYMKSTMCNF